MKRCLLTHSLTNTLIKNKNEVGEHPLFSEEKVLEVCRLNQIGLLTSICAAYAFIAKQTSPSRAKTEIIKLLKRGSEVTGPEITALRNRFEGAKPKPEPKVEAVTETTLMEIISSGTTFDNLLLTPPDDLMTEVGDSSEEALRQRFDSYADILSPNADFTIAVRGEHQSATLKLARVLGKRSPSVFYLRGKPANDRLVDISKEVILVTSKAIEQPNGLAPEGDLARQLASGAGENLRLFAESGADGWSVVLGSEASLPESE